MRWTLTVSGLQHWRSMRWKHLRLTIPFRYASSGDRNRSIIHHQTGRSYYQGKEKVAQNRKPGFEQKTTALSQWYEEQVRIHGEKEAEKLRSQLRVEKSCRHYNDMDRFLPGAVFLYEGKRYVLSGRITNGKYLRACGQGMKNFPAAECTFIRHNAGLVFI